MAIKYVTELRKDYANMLRANGRMDRAIEIANAPSYTPILKVNEVHPEAEPDTMSYNLMVNDIVCDLTIVNLEFESMGLLMKEMMENSKLRLQAVKKTLLKEKGRQQDLNILCNKYNDFTNVIPIVPDDEIGSFTEDNGVYFSNISSHADIEYTVVSISGNGYEGNDHVYKDDKFLKTSIDTSKRSYINDKSAITIYEYSRITASNSETMILTDLNFDSIEARCLLTISSATVFNTAKFSEGSTDVSVLDVFVSDDGVQFNKVSKRTIDLNNSDKQYQVQDYIQGSGILSFPSTRFLRLSLQSNSYTDDKIAFLKTDIVDSVPETKPVVVGSAKRHVIKIPDLSLSRYLYASESVIYASNLVSTTVKSVALFCNEYIPDHLTDLDYVRYIMTINGKDHEVVPVNSSKNGKKIIRTAQYDSAPEYVEYVNEDIKSVHLTIVIKSPNKFVTPFISNLKLLVGGN